jgi:tetratricopeptide (TPR) repeat protein
MSFALVTVGFSVTKVAEYDFWWHLNLGREVFQSGWPIVADSFSYTFEGASQFNGEWFADLIFYFVYEMGGFLAIGLLKAILVLAIFYVLYRTLIDLSEEDTVRWFVATVLTLIVVLFAIRFRLMIRPYLFSFLFFALFVFILSRFSRTGNAGLLYWLPLIEIIWANTSKGLFFGPALICIYLAGGLINHRFDRRLLIALAAVVLASVCSPEGLAPYYFLLAIAQSPETINVVGEQQPLSVQLLWGPAWHYTAGYQLLFLGSLVYFLFQRGWRNAVHLLLFVSFLAASIIMIRMIGFFALIAGAFLIFPLHSLMQRLPDRLFAKQALTNSAVAISLLVIGGLAVFGSDTYAFGIGPKERHIPDDAITWLDRERIDGRIFNSYPFGGYISWASRERQVFIDGRINQLYPREFHQNYIRIIGEPAKWAEAEQKWDFTVAVLEYDYLSFGRHFPRHLNENPEWALVYWGQQSLIYLKRTEENLRAIQKHEYSIIKPNFNDFSYLNQLLGARHSNEMTDRILDEAGRDVARNPNNQELRLARLFLKIRLGKTSDEQALMEIESTLAMEPDLSMEHAAAAYFHLRMGNKVKAKEEYYKALAIDPNDQMAKSLQPQLQ